ncbi:MAG: tetratricopeptide repeat protein [Chlorobiales bacterium]
MPSDKSQSHFNSAEKYFQEGRFNEAQSEYEQSLSHNPDFVEALIGLGCVHLNKGKLKEAEECLEKAVMLAPENALAHFYLGNVYDDNGKNQLALQTVEKAIALKPDLAEAYLALGFIHYRMGNRAKVSELYSTLLNIDGALAKQLQHLIEPH